MSDKPSVIRIYKPQFDQGFIECTVHRPPFRHYNLDPTYWDKFYEFVPLDAFTQERDRADRLERENKVLSERFVSKTEYDALEAELNIKNENIVNLSQANRDCGKVIEKLQAEVAELRAIADLCEGKGGWKGYADIQRERDEAEAKLAAAEAERDKLKGAMPLELVDRRDELYKREIGQLRALCDRLAEALEKYKGKGGPSYDDGMIATRDIQYWADRALAEYELFKDKK